jgi:WD40 repeat protein
MRLILVYRACLAVLGGYTSLVSRIQLLPSTVLTGDAGSFLRLWSTETYKEIWSVEAGQNSITGLKCVGSKIVTGSSDGSVKLWDLDTGSLLKELASSDAAWQVDVLGDKIIALVSRKGEVILEVSNNLALKSLLERVG